LATHLATEGVALSWILYHRSHGDKQMKPNKFFELTVQDIDIIESALNAKVSRRTHAVIQGQGDREKLIQEANQIRDLLGRLHNQKHWYRPKDDTYVSG